MLGKKVFFIKEFLKQNKVEGQIDFDEFLTIYTKEKLNAIVNDEIHNARNEEKELTGIHFIVTFKENKQIVDSQTLSRVLERLRYEIRDTDILVEWSDGEFIILLLECTIESAQKIAFLLKSIVEAKDYNKKHIELNYTITYHKEDDTIDSFLSRIDAIETA